MSKKQPIIVRYRGYENQIQLPEKINSFILTHFASAINEWAKRRRYDPLIIDFSAVRQPYSNGMLGIISIVTSLKANGYKIIIRLPNDKNVRDLFVRTNWAHLLDPSLTKAGLGVGRHLNTRQFNDYKEVADITNDFMHIVLRSMVIPKDIISALEWSMYEICDNVINHSDSKVGGFVEAVTYTKERRIAFTVADAGRGVLNSLREGFPALKTNVQAIGEAIKAGVTRNKEVGQGNGLAGSLRITTMTGGSFDITSGLGRFYCTNNHNNGAEAVEKGHFFPGTSVSGQILLTDKFSIGKALEFNGIEYVPTNIIELEYELDNEDSLLIQIKKETTGVGTRKAGKQLRLKTLNLISSKPGYVIIVDWAGIPVISSSFADEFIGKLYVLLGQEKFNSTIKNQSMETLIKQLLDKAISQRIAQEKD